MKFKNYFNKIFAEFARDFTSFGNPLILIILSAMIIGINSNLIVIVIGLIFIELSCALIKLIWHKERPVRENHKNFLEKIDAGSFPSVHSARSLFVFLFLFTLITENIRFIFLGLPFIVGITRIILNKHYLIDICVGYLIGLIALLGVRFLWIG